MSFLKKLKKVAKTAGKAYLTYQTGGLSAVAAKALSKKGRAPTLPIPMMQSMVQSGGLAALPTTFASTTPLLKNIGKKALRAVPFVGTAATLYDIGSDIVGASKATVTKAFGGRRKYRRINPGNVKALRRSIRRLHGAEKLFRQVLSVQGKKHAGIKPKHRKR